MPSLQTATAACTPGARRRPPARCTTAKHQHPRARARAKPQHVCAFLQDPPPVSAILPPWAGHGTAPAAGLDLVALRASVTANSLHSISIPDLHLLSALPEIRVSVAYRLPCGTELASALPADMEALQAAEVVYEVMPGWCQDLTGAKSWQDLPENAHRFVRWVEGAAGVRCTGVGVAPGAPLLLKPRESVCFKDALAACICEFDALDPGEDEAEDEL